LPAPPGLAAAAASRKRARSPGPLVAHRDEDEDSEDERRASDVEIQRVLERRRAAEAAAAELAKQRPFWMAPPEGEESRAEAE
jgi:hypothetical protein